MKQEEERLPLFGVGPLYAGVVAGLTAAGVICGEIPALSGGKLGALRIPAMILGVLLIALGVFLWVQAVLVSRLDDEIKNGNLVTTGVYAWVRNPIYSAILAVCTGVLLLAGNAFFFALVPGYWLFLTVLMKRTEEKWLRARYGAAYEDYCRCVNRVVPWFLRRGG